MGRTREFDELEVLDRAIELFRDRGYESTSVSDLEAHLGVGRQSLYNTFGDKRQLFLRALSRYSEYSGEMVALTLGEPHAGWAALHAYVHSVVDFVTDGDQARACLMTSTIVEVGDEDPEIAKRCSRNQKNVLLHIRKALEQAVEDGDLDSELDTGSTAITVAAQVHGYSVLARSGISARRLHRAVDAMLDRFAAS